MSSVVWRLDGSLWEIFHRGCEIPQRVPAYPYFVLEEHYPSDLIQLDITVEKLG